MKTIHLTDTQYAALLHMAEAVRVTAYNKQNSIIESLVDTNQVLPAISALAEIRSTAETVH